MIKPNDFDKTPGPTPGAGPSSNDPAGETPIRDAGGGRSVKRTGGAVQGELAPGPRKKTGVLKIALTGAVIVIGAWLINHSRQSTQQRQPASAPVVSQGPAIAVPHGNGGDPAAAVTGATIENVRLEPYVMPQQLPVTTYNLLIHTSLAVTATAPAKVCVIARFYQADGSPVKGQNENYTDVMVGGIAAVWDWASFNDPAGAKFNDFVLKIPQNTLPSGNGMYAVVSIEDASRTRELARVQTPSFDNR
jgi:hypothetical protein